MLKKYKRDIILVALILVVAFILYVFMQFYMKKDGEIVLIKVDGEIVKELDLSENTQIEVTGYNGGKNTIIIQDRKVYMEDADCPDKLCVKMGKIDKDKETIVCMPHRVVVEISKKSNDSDIDSIAR